MKKSKAQREMFLLAVLTSMTVFTWIALDVYQAFFKQKLPEIQESRLEPLNPNLDMTVVENLKNRKIFTFEEVTLPALSPEETTEEVESPTPTEIPEVIEESEGS